MNKLFSKTVKNQVDQRQLPSHKLFTEEESTTFSTEDVKDKAGATTTISTTSSTTIATNYSRLSYADTSNRNSQYDLNLFDRNVFTESLTYHLVRASPFSGDVEVLYPFIIPKDNMIIHDSEAKRISLVGEPTVTIRSETFFLEAKLRRTGAFSNTWHFDFEGKDYRWKPIQLGAKDCDLVCELVEYDISTKISTSANITIPKILTLSGSVISPSARKNKIKIATLSRNSNDVKSINDRNTIGELVIFKEAWISVNEHRALEVLLLLSCMVMLDVIETS